jgi:transcriptional antiterminator
MRGLSFMALNYDIEIDVSGRDQEDRAAIIAYLSKLLSHSEENVIIQHADPMIDEQLILTDRELRSKLKDKTIFIREIMHE